MNKRGNDVIKESETSNATTQANQAMSKSFNDYSERMSSEPTSDTEMANQKIQEQFYQNEDDNLLPFHVDINNPPVKK
ncbi:hypothetical protein [Bacillus sp. X1(2014)]|uniref:hypothetical protein n=1 Tax=Bacillus sp. X1(2014) TaxID=1565991 RepID=UPI00119DF2B8|nr:hypothetical protein [Bacillus sp. X1(2014)]